MTTNSSRFNSLKQASYDIMRNLLIEDDISQEIAEDESDGQQNIVEDGNDFVI